MEKEEGAESLGHDSGAVARDLSLEMKGHMKTLLEENLGKGLWKDEVASTVAAPLDANHVYAPRATLLADPDTAVAQ